MSSPRKYSVFWQEKPRNQVSMSSKPPTHMWSMTSSRNKKPKVKLQEDDRNCQENMRPKKPRTHMRSVTNTDNMWLPKPLTRRLCKNRYCQSTRCFKKATKGLKQRFQRNQDVEMTRTVNHPSLWGQRSPKVTCS